MTRLFGISYSAQHYGYTPGQEPIYMHAAFFSQWTAEDYLHRHFPRYAASGAFLVRELRWTEREVLCFSNATYSAPVWAEERFWRQNQHIHREHFAHVSLDDPKMIAFTESPEKGERDIQTRMKPGKYLKKYFGDVLTTKQIAFFAEWWANGQRPTLEVKTELGFASTPDEIEHVYANGPESCMSGGWDGRGTHPARVYGAGDLAIAYLTDASDGDNAGNVIARAISWPDRELYGRIYPTPDRWSDDGFGSYEEACAVQAALVAQLKAKGWTSVYEGVSGKNFDGARLLKIRCEDGWRMPYLDHGSFSEHPGGEYWTMERDGECSAGSTGGVFHDEDYDDGMVTCPSCDERVDELEMTRVHAAWSVLYGPHGGNYVCEHCSSRDAFYCDATNAYYPEDECVCLADGRTIVYGYFEYHGGYTCDETGEQCLPEDNPPVEMASGEVWSDVAFAERGFTCGYDGKNYPHDEQSALWPGFPASYDDCESITPADRVLYAPAGVFDANDSLTELETAMAA